VRQLFVQLLKFALAQVQVRSPLFEFLLALAGPALQCLVASREGLLLLVERCGQGLQFTPLLLPGGLQGGRLFGEQFAHAVFDGRQFTR
jgi:hypothetical protein